MKAIFVLLNFLGIVLSQVQETVTLTDASPKVNYTSGERGVT
jgi:hypothetical protein